MLDLLFNNGAGWFTVPALIGTAVFVLRLVLMLLGVAHFDIGHDFHHGGGLGHDPGVGHAAAHGHGSDQDSTYSFEVLSIQSIAAFIMGGGWGGFAALHGSGLSWPLSIGIAILCGGGTMWVLAMMFKGMHELQTSGNVMIDAAVGVEGDVYVGVPASGQGRGQVRLVVDQTDRIYNAVSQDGELPTRTRVKVVRINEDNTVTVAAV